MQDSAASNAAKNYATIQFYSGKLATIFRCRLTVMVSIFPLTCSFLARALSRHSLVYSWGFRPWSMYLWKPDILTGQENLMQENKILSLTLRNKWNKMASSSRKITFLHEDDLDGSLRIWLNLISTPIYKATWSDRKINKVICMTWVDCLHQFSIKCNCHI